MGDAAGGLAGMTRSVRLRVALGVNVALVVGEVLAGIAAHSAALFSDAGHNLADVAAVLLSLAAVRWALRPRSESRTYGNHRGTILAALANATLLAVVTCAIVALAIDRIVHPVVVHGLLMSEVGGVALVANGVAAFVLRDRTRDLNMRSVTWHMAGDVAASAAVVAAGLVITVGGHAADQADPAASLAVAVLVMVGAVRVMRESADVLLESAPPDVDLSALRTEVTAVPGVGEVHDLHVWSLSSEYRALSAHLVLTGHPTLEEAQTVGVAARERMSHRFGIAHTTFELECERCDEDLAEPCAADGPHGVATRVQTRHDPE